MTLQSLIKSKIPKNGRVLIIAVDGRGGSGKSTLAKLLSEKLEAEIIHTDDFASQTDPINWYPKLIETIFIPISRGAKTLGYERSVWFDDYRKPIVDQPVTEIMIVEGVSATREAFDEYVDIRIFVDTPREIAIERGVQRELVDFPDADEKEIRKNWDEWVENEDKYFQRENPKKKADLVIDGTKDFQVQLK